MRLMEKLCRSMFCLTGARSSSQAEKYCMRGDVNCFFIFKIFVFVSIVSALLLCRAVLSLSYIISKQEIKHFTSSMYVRMACGARVVFLDGA